jgi:hypothetical protein
MQNVREYINVKLHTDSSTALKAIADPNFKNYSIIDENLVQTNHFQAVIKHITPIAIGITILELVCFYFFYIFPVAQLAARSNRNAEGVSSNLTWEKDFANIFCYFCFRAKLSCSMPGITKCQRPDASLTWA